MSHENNSRVRPAGCFSAKQRYMQCKVSGAVRLNFLHTPESAFRVEGGISATLIRSFARPGEALKGICLLSQLPGALTSSDFYKMSFSHALFSSSSQLPQTHLNFHIISPLSPFSQLTLK